MEVTAQVITRLICIQWKFTPLNQLTAREPTNQPTNRPTLSAPYSLVNRFTSKYVILRPLGNVTWNNSNDKVLMGAQEKKLQKLQISQNEILCLTILPVFSPFLWNLKFIFWGSHKKLSLVLLQITIHVIISLALEKCKKECGIV